MAIYCMQCGKELPDDANFCLKCGKPLKGATASTVQSDPQWEYCEISCKEAGFMGWKSYFVANAVGARGVYIAAKSTTVFIGVNGDDGYPYGDPPDEKQKAALNEVITQLSADGWQPAGKGDGWWKYKYRRQVSS